MSPDLKRLLEGYLRRRSRRRRLIELRTCTRVRL